jgi:hypothetical protein
VRQLREGVHEGGRVAPRGWLTISALGLSSLGQRLALDAVTFNISGALEQLAEVNEKANDAREIANEVRKDVDERSRSRHGRQEGPPVKKAAARKRVAA